MRALTPLTVIAASLLALTACGGADEPSADATNAGLHLVAPGTLTVCADVPYPPFALAKDGEYTGFDIEMMRHIAQGMDLDLSVKDIGFDGLQSGAALAAGTCDIGAAAMTITKDREKHLDFSDPYYDSLQSLLVPADSAITSINDLAGKTVGVKQGTTGKAYAEKHVPKDTKILTYQSNSELYPALAAGTIDAVLQDHPANHQHAKDGAFTVVEKYQTGEQYGFPVKEDGADELLGRVNQELAAMRSDGTYDTLYKQYFGS